MLFSFYRYSKARSTLTETLINLILNLEYKLYTILETSSLKKERFMSKKTNVQRRNFLKLTAAGAAGLAIATPVKNVFAATKRTPSGTAPLNKWPGRVVINFNKNTATGDVDPTTAQITTIQTMVDDSIKLLTGQTDLGTAWKSIFPSTGTNAISLTSKIVIKVPVACESGRSTPHWWSVQAITKGLQLINFGGTLFPAANITIYDGACSNNLNACGFNATNFPGLGGFIFDNLAGGGYTDGATDNAGNVQQYAATLHNANFLINVFSPRGHQGGEQFTLGFKNHYGTYSYHPHDYWLYTTANVANQAQSPWLRNVNCTGPVYNKNVLSICSGLYGLVEGHGPTTTTGPDNYSVYSKHMDSTSTNTNPTTIIMGTDPISVEMQAIKMMRIQGTAQGYAKTNPNAGLYTTDAMPSYLKASAGILVTGGVWQTLLNSTTVMDNIGIINESAMNILRIVNGVIITAIKNRTDFQNAAETAAITASQIHGHGSTFIEYSLPSSHAGNMAAIEIYDIKGSLVTRLSHRISGYNNHLSWDETNQSGSRVSKGVYIVHLISGAVRVSSRFALAM